MTTYDADGITLERVREHVWEIPREGDMRVPARVLASESLLDEISDDRTLQQLKNTTHLPGIQQYALCMPDGHQGYGFPVGGVAAIDAETGCISPGAIGYDINCLTGDTEVRLSHGRKLPIEKLRERFEDERAVVATADDLVDAEIRLFTESGPRTVYAVETETGRTVQATADHPFKTSDGMVAVGDLEPGDSVYVHPFEGVEHEDPAEFTVLAREDVADANPQTVRALEKRGLLPLSSTDEAFQRLLKLVGYLLGGGSCARNGQTWFHGEPEDLNRIREDIRALGFEPSEIYERDRGHEVDGETVEPPAHSCKTTARSLWRVLVELGVPEGPNVASGFTTPGYFDRLADWQKALFCSAYFGAEMTAPATEHDGNLYCPELSQTRTRDTVVDGREFLDDLSEFLDGLGIETNRAEESEFDSNRDRDTVRLRLGVTDDSESLIRFFTRVGYRYHGEKQREAMKVVKYLRTEKREIRSRERIAGEANALADGGTDTAATRSEFDSNDRSDERRPRSGRRRSGFDRPDYEAFREETTVNHDGTLQARVVSVQEVGEKPVYDIGVSHDEHTFLGDGFVVSNCGVRMMKTSLTYDDVRGREAELVDSLFANVPTGLGGGGVYEGSNADVEAILERGVDWALEEGFAVQSDRDHCEDGGRRPDADPARVSQKAKDRGRNQVGSLGSGNHFLEVQRVTDVYREDVAGEFGLEDDQIVVLVHCGSRGLGHQVCTDYLREIEQTHAGLLDRLPDRELAAAPAGSQLAEDYYGAMCAAINFAWVNRQLVMHQTREVLGKLFGLETEEMELLYDVAHNIGKKEVHEVGVGPEGRPVGGGDAVDSAERELYVHRKGATRAFPAGRPELPAAYGDVGQPVIVPGSMGAGSYVLRGGDRSLPETFGSTAHGAGRLMSRTQAKQEFWGGDVQDDLRDQEHVYVKAESGATVAEEAPGVYKDVDEVVRVSDALGIGDRVARTFPVCNIKG